MEEQEKKIQEDLQIDDTNLGGELKRQAGKFFYWATLQAKAAAKSRQYRSYLDALKAERAKDFKTNMTAEDPKIRITERMLDDFLDTDETVKNAKDALIGAQYTEELLDVAVDALRQRHYALIELVRSRETETAARNEYEIMKREFEERELNKRGGI